MLTKAKKNVKRTTILATQGYQVKQTLGEGAYGVVKSAYSVRHKADVAIKIMAKKRLTNDALRKFMPRELQVVRSLRHRNIICFLQTIETTNKVYLIMELAPNGDILGQIREKKFIPEPQAAIWFGQLVEAIEYCHKKGVVHRDLKCENVLLDANNNVKLADFGFGRFVGRSEDTRTMDMCRTYCGSYAYAPPEILKAQPYDPSLTDIWSMGVILFTMIHGRLPYDDSNHRVLIRQIQSEVQFPKNPPSSPECRDLLRKLLTHRRKRATIKQIKKDPWYVKYNGEPKTDSGFVGSESLVEEAPSDAEES